jgi:hypothetical protein
MICRRTWTRFSRSYAAIQNKETLYLSLEAEKIAKNEQQTPESDERTGMIENYLESKLPDNWDA